MLARRTVLGGLAAVPALTAARAFAKDGPAAFLVIGDWGKDGSPDQRAVAAAMGAAAVEVGSRSVISVGDNFYPHGVASAEDPKWLSSYEAVYTAPSLQTPWYAALGNHDYRGVPQAQIDYARRSHRWRMPSPYYQVSGASLGIPALDLFVTDTSPLVQGEHETCAQLIHGEFWLPRRQAQLRWLDASLARSRAACKIVVGHHPIYSGGHHGSEPFLVQHIRPLLERHGVQLYLNGHDHDLQHIERAGVRYVCAGSGGGGSVAAPVAIEGTRFAASAAGFAVVSVGAGNIEVQLRDAANRTLHRTAIPIAGA